MPDHIEPNTPPVPPKVVPGYPDVWGYTPPLGEKLWKWVLLPDGDVGIGLLNNKDYRTSFRRLFFHKPLSKADICRIWKNAGGNFTNAGGNHLGTIPLPHGHMFSPMPALGHFRACYSGLNNSIAIFAHHGARSSILMHKTLLYVLKPPQRVVSCPKEGSFMEYVESLYPFPYTLLPDGTLLTEVGVEHPFLLRLTEDFHTRSPLLNRRLFIVNTANLRRWTEDYGHADTNGPAGQRLGRMQLNLYHRLMTLKHRKP